MRNRGRSYIKGWATEQNITAHSYHMAPSSWLLDRRSLGEEIKYGGLGPISSTARHIMMLFAGRTTWSPRGTMITPTAEHDWGMNHVRKGTAVDNMPSHTMFARVFHKNVMSMKSKTRPRIERLGLVRYPKVHVRSYRVTWFYDDCTRILREHFTSDFSTRICGYNVTFPRDSL